MKQEDIVGELSKKYKDALVHVQTFQEMMEENEYEIVSTGTTLRDENLMIQGDLDIIVKKKGEDKLRVIDMKFSGLLHDKWSDLGWETSSLPYKDKIMMQAVHYKMIFKANYGYEPDFYFWVFSSTNTKDIKNIKVLVNKEKFDEHTRYIHTTRDLYNKNNENGWIARPTPVKCESCPVKELGCKQAISLPKEQTVYYYS